MNINCTAISKGVHVIPDGYGPISVQAFLDNVMLSDNSLLNGSDPHLERPFSVGKAVNMDAVKDLHINSSALTLFVLSDEIHVFSRFSFSIFCQVRIEVWSPFYTAVSLLNSGLIDLKHCDAHWRLMDMAKSFNYH